MRIIDPGHTFALVSFDGGEEVIDEYMKREGPGYPGNVGHHPGTNMQERLRGMISRTQYLDNQIPHWRNKNIINLLRMALENLEHRAAERHNRILFASTLRIEDIPFCLKCGHIGCEGSCHG